MKAYSSAEGVKAAIKCKGLHLLAYEIETVRGGWSAKFFTQDAADAREVRARGFMAEVNPERAS